MFPMLSISDLFLSAGYSRTSVNLIYFISINCTEHSSDLYRVPERQMMHRMIRTA